MIVIYVLIFCRIALGLLFIISFLGKTPNLTLFERTITGFGILPERFSRIATLVVLMGELTVILFLALGGPFLGPGFGVAAVLLLVFSAVLGSALARKLETPCNCLGPTEKPISRYDLWRNGGFILCALMGLVILALPGRGPVNLSLVEWVLVGLVAAVFVAVWTQIGEAKR